MDASRTLHIDFVSDVVCPWCAIGLCALETAVERASDAVRVQIRVRPFQLNPHAPPDGEDIVEHLGRKYGLTPQQVHANHAAIAQRGEAVGFEFRFDRRTRTCNTFDAHRLLHWAEAEGRQLALKHALLRAYFTDGDDVSSRDVLVRLAAEVGLDAAAAGAILAGDAHAEAVRAEIARYTALGIQAVPSVIVDERHLIQGGQPPEVFEQALRQLAAATD